MEILSNITCFISVLDRQIFIWMSLPVTIWWCHTLADTGCSADWSITVKPAVSTSSHLQKVTHWNTWSLVQLERWIEPVLKTSWTVDYPFLWIKPSYSKGWLLKAGLTVIDLGGWYMCQFYKRLYSAWPVWRIWIFFAEQFLLQAIWFSIQNQLISLLLQILNFVSY